MSKNRLYAVQAFMDGFRVLQNGEVFHPTKKFRVTIKSNHKTKSYKLYIFSHKHTNVQVHQLAAYQKFNNEWLFGELLVRHLNNNSLDNSLDNIALGTDRDNYYDSPPESRCRDVSHMHKAIRKFTDEQILEIRELAKTYSFSKLGKKFGCSRVAIGDIVKRNSYNHVL